MLNVSKYVETHRNTIRFNHDVNEVKMYFELDKCYFIDEIIFNEEEKRI